MSQSYRLKPVPLKYLNMIARNECSLLASNAWDCPASDRCESSCGAFQARVTVVDWLKQLGLYRGTTPNAMRLGVCSRSKDVIEPVLKPQWWVSCGSMAADARAAASDGRLKIIPSDSVASWNRCPSPGLLLLLSPPYSTEEDYHYL